MRKQHPDKRDQVKERRKEHEICEDAEQQVKNASHGRPPPVFGRHSSLQEERYKFVLAQGLDAFCIASSDGDFTPLVMQLLANGNEIYGFGKRKTPEPFVNACTTFLYVKESGGSVSQSPVIEQSQKSPKAESQRLAKLLTQDAKLVTTLRGAVEATGLFEIVKADSGQSYIADKRNSERTSHPNQDIA